MGRELRRKQAKKQGKEINNEDLKVEGINFKNLFKLVIISGIIFGLFYLATALFMTEELDWFSKKNETTNTDTTPSVANTILAKEALSQKEDTYYVYFYDYTDEVSSVSTSIRSIKDKVYKVNTKDGFNSNYVSEETNKDASNIEELKVKALTLIKVVDGFIVEYYEGKEEINNNFGE